MSIWASSLAVSARELLAFGGGAADLHGLELRLVLAEELSGARIHLASLRLGAFGALLPLVEDPHQRLEEEWVQHDDEGREEEKLEAMTVRSKSTNTSAVANSLA